MQLGPYEAIRFDKREPLLRCVTPTVSPSSADGAFRTMHFDLLLLVSAHLGGLTCVLVVVFRSVLAAVVDAHFMTGVFR